MLKSKVGSMLYTKNMRVKFQRWVFWKHFTSTNIWMIRDGISFEWCFQHQISVSWTQGGTSKKSKVYGNLAVNWVMFSPIIWQLVFPPPKINGKLNITVLIHLNHPPPFLDWCNYSTTSFERFHIQLRSLVVARLIWFALERLATRRVCILWEYSSATIVDDDAAELISKWTD